MLVILSIMLEYTAQDGLNVIRHLGLQINEEETELFKENWDNHYFAQGYDLVATTQFLYAHCLTRKLHANLVIAKFAANGIDREFKRRLEITDLFADIEAGKPLKDIFAQGPHYFIICVSDQERPVQF